MKKRTDEKDTDKKDTDKKDTDKTISKSYLDKMKIGWTPKCPYCDNKLLNAYEASGLVSSKCLRCRKTSLVNFSERKIIRID